jgi:hypothetical protein
VIPDAAADRALLPVTPDSVHAPLAT